MKRNLVIVTATAVALVTGGTAVALAAGGAADSGSGSHSGSVAVRQARAAGQERLTAVHAIDAAVKARPGTVVSAELDGDEKEWDVAVLGSGDSAVRTVHVDPVTGRVLGTDTDTDRDGDDADDRRELATLKEAKVGARQAAETAASKGFVTSVELTDEDDAPATSWDVSVLPAGGTGDDWSVDAKTGTLAPDHDDSDDPDRNDGNDGNDD